MSDEKKKNIHAVALGRLGGKGRAEALSPQELSEIGKEGARQRALKIPKAKRSHIASIAARKRWQKKKPVTTTACTKKAKRRVQRASLRFSKPLDRASWDPPSHAGCGSLSIV